MSEPLVSVVVATRGRPERLGRLLDSLRGQTLEASSFEVVVVQDGEDPSSAAALADPPSGLALRRLTLPSPRGPAAARNAGWRAARAPYVAFTDDDCVADPGWLAGVVEVLDREADVVVQGRTAPDPAEAAFAGLFSRTVRVDSLGPQYETCNIVYPRALLESLGGFDESFGPRPTAEDTDLAWRAIEAGARTRFAPSALVFHAVEPLGPVRLLSVALRWGGAVRIFRAHPQLRTMLYRRLFWNVWHYLMWRTLLSLAGPAWLRRLLVARHMASLHERAREGGAGSWAIPFLLAHDLVECAAVARGAVRYRTLVL